MFLPLRFRRIWLMPVLAILVVSLSGCIYLAVGGLGALGGYAVSPDTVEGEMQVSYDVAWDHAVEVVAIMGMIQFKDYKLGRIEAKVNNAAVFVDLTQISSSWIRMRVKARKNMLPNIRTAQNIWVKIKHRITQ